MLTIKNLKVSLPEGKQIINGIDLAINPGEVHALMGPNGSGKSTLSQVIMGSSLFSLEPGASIKLDDNEIKDLLPNERAKLGLFLSFQNPVEIPGVSLFEFLKQAYSTVTDKQIEAEDFMKLLQKEATKLNLPAEFLQRELNVGMSGGEKKKMEMLQMMVLKPKYIIVDEVDSGLDIDALKVVAKALQEMEDRNAGILIITHYKRILEYIKPTRVSIISDGQIKATGGPELVDDLEKLGYDPFLKNNEK